MGHKLDVKQLTDQDIIASLYYSQLLMAVIGLLFYWLLFPTEKNLLVFLRWDGSDVLIYGVLLSIGIALLEIALEVFLPNDWLDDGGINDRMIRALSMRHVWLAMLVVAFVEEGFFRALLQTTYGLVVASICFGLVHVRYIKRPLLIIVAILLGFYLGWLFQYTHSIWVPIAAHYTINVGLALYVKHEEKWDKEGGRS